MAFGAFLRIEGIPGESTDDAHTDWIEVLSFGWSVAQTAVAAASSGGASAERADFQDLSIVKTMDKTSPKLAVACADGTHISEVVFELCQAGGNKLKYMEYKLSDCIVSSVQTDGSAQGDATLPLEIVSFNYGKIEWTYTQLKPDGSSGGNVTGGWDIESNKYLI